MSQSLFGVLRKREALEVLEDLRLVDIKERGALRTLRPLSTTVFELCDQFLLDSRARHHFFVELVLQCLIDPNPVIRPEPFFLRFQGNELIECAIKLRLPGLTQSAVVRRWYTGGRFLGKRRRRLPAPRQ